MARKKCLECERETVNINWQITTDDKACVKAILEKQRNAELVRDRYE
jgi:hypothetical protein